MSYEFVLAWGSKGSSPGQFNEITGVAVDRSGEYVYVVDTGNYRVQKFDSNGNPILTWGSFGSAPGLFNWPYGIAVDSSGNVYVVDYGNSRIQKFDGSGKFILQWGSFGYAPGQFNLPYGIMADGFGKYVYVADEGVSRIKKFDSLGNFILEWGSMGSGQGQFLAAYGVAVDSSGNVYVTDGANRRIQKFDGNGNFVSAWGCANAATGQCPGGVGFGRLGFPFDVAVDSSGNVYVADSPNSCIQKFDDLGNFITQWGSPGSGPGLFSSGIVYVAVDPSGKYVYVPDVNRVEKFQYIAARPPPPIPECVALEAAFLEAWERYHQNPNSANASALAAAYKKWETICLQTSSRNPSP